MPKRGHDSMDSESVPSKIPRTDTVLSVSDLFAELAFHDAKTDSSDVDGHPKGNDYFLSELVISGNRLPLHRSFLARHRIQASSSNHSGLEIIFRRNAYPYIQDLILQDLTMTEVRKLLLRSPELRRSASLNEVATLGERARKLWIHTTCHTIPKRSITFLCSHSPMNDFETRRCGRCGKGPFCKLHSHRFHKPKNLLKLDRSIKHPSWGRTFKTCEPCFDFILKNWRPHIGVANGFEVCHCKKYLSDIWLCNECPEAMARERFLKEFQRFVTGEKNACGRCGTFQDTKITWDGKGAL